MENQIEFFNTKKSQLVGADQDPNKYFYVDTLTGETNLCFDLEQLEGKRLRDFTIDNLTTTNIITVNQSEQDKLKITQGNETIFTLDFNNGQFWQSYYTLTSLQGLNLVFPEGFNTSLLDAYKLALSALQDLTTEWDAILTHDFVDPLTKQNYGSIKYVFLQNYNLEKRFEAIEHDIKILQEDVYTIQDTLSQMSKELAEFATQFQTVQVEFDRINATLKEYGLNIDRIFDDITTLQQEVDDFKSRIGQSTRINGEIIEYYFDDQTRPPAYVQLNACVFFLCNGQYINYYPGKGYIYPTKLMSTQGYVPDFTEFDLNVIYKA